MSRPKLIINKLGGNLITSTPSEDGTSLLVISMPAGYSAVITSKKFVSLEGAEAAGITAANDTAFSALVHYHVKNFYAFAGDGVTLHILDIAPESTLTNIFTEGQSLNDSLKLLLETNTGAIKLLGVALNPSYAESHTGSISADLEASIPLASLFSDNEFSKNRPLEIFIEGRKFTGTSAAAEDLSTYESPNVSIMVGVDNDDIAAMVASIPLAVNAADIGLLLGKVAGLPVQRNIGRIKDGFLVGVTSPALSGGTLLSSLNDSDLDTLHSKSYILYNRFFGKNGFYFNDDRTCEAITEDFSFITRNRVINKAARIAYSTFIDEILDDYPLDPATGKIPTSQLKGFEAILEDAITEGMINDVDQAEITSVSVNIDPDLYDTVDGAFTIELSIIPVGYNRNVTINVQYELPESA